MEKVAKVLEYMGETYKYSHAKKNILTYISQPYHYYDDWEGDGGILVVEYRPNCKKPSISCASFFVGWCT